MALRDVLWEPKKGPLAFVAIGFALSISTNLISNIVPEESWAWWFLIAGVPAGVVLLILSPWFSKLFPIPEREPVSTLISPARRCRILVGLASMGGGIGSMRDAILYHRPEWVYLVHSEASQKEAEELKTKFVKGMTYGFEIQEDNFVLLATSDEDFNDPEKIRELIEREVYAELPENRGEDDVMVDITGGMKGTTAGAFLAGLAETRNLEILIPKVKNEEGRAVPSDEPGRPVEIDIAYRIKRVKRP
jgi:hypothetical protein